MTNNDPFHGIEIRDIEVYVPTEETPRVAAEIVDERVRQISSGSEASLPNGVGPWWTDAAAEAVRITAHRKETGYLGWSDVVLMYTFLALASSDVSLRGELIRLAATVTAWVEDIDRKAGK